MFKQEDNSHKLKILREWFENNPKLPEEIDPILLKRFLKCMSNDVEQTKKLIELNYTLRNKHPHFFIERNPDDESTRKALAVSDLVLLPGLTKERHKVLLFRMTNLDPSTRNSVEETKIFFMMADTRFTMYDNEIVQSDCNITENKDVAIVEEDNEADTEGFYDSVDHIPEANTNPKAKPESQNGATAESNNDDIDDDNGLAEGDIQIVDIGGYTMRHLTRISIFVFRVYLQFLQEAYPVRLRAMHLVNCPAYMDKMIAFIKPFMSEDVYKLIHFHKGCLDSLYEYVPREMLPQEYGGYAGTMAELKASWLQKVSEKKSYLMDPKQWHVKPAPKRNRWSWF